MVLLIITSTIVEHSDGKLVCSVFDLAELLLQTDILKVVPNLQLSKCFCVCCNVPKVESPQLLRSRLKVASLYVSVSFLTGGGHV